MKQVLFIGMSPNRGGIETYLINVFLHLEGHGFHFTFLNIYKKKLAYQDIILNHGGSIQQLGFNTSFIGHLYRYRTALKFFRKHHDYDIVYVNAVTIDVLFWIKAAKKCGIKKLIVHSHNSGRKYSSRLIIVLSYLLSRYNRIWLKFHPNIIKLAASESCGRWMFGKNSKFHVINNGINPNDYRYNKNIKLNMRKKLGIPLNSKVLITTGRLVAQKNYPKILRVFQCVHNMDNNTHLIIAGNGVLMPKVKVFIHQYQLSPYVHLLGSVNHQIIPELLSASDVMIMPSFYEAIPFSLTEAQANGVPALVSSEGITRKANITGRVYYMSLRKSDNIWAKCIIHIMKHDYEYNIRIQMNNDIKQSNFNMNKSLKELKNRYLE